MRVAGGQEEGDRLAPRRGGARFAGLQKLGRGEQKEKCAVCQAREELLRLLLLWLLPLSCWWRRVFAPGAQAFSSWPTALSSVCPASQVHARDLFLVVRFRFASISVDIHRVPLQPTKMHYNLLVHY